MNQPPYNETAERSLLGLTLITPDALLDAQQTLTPCMFYMPRHQTIWQAILTLANQHKPVDPVTVAEQLTQDGHNIPVGDIISITADSGVDAPRYIEIIHNTHTLRQLMTTGQTITQMAAQRQDAGTVAEEAERLLRTAIDGRNQTSTRRIADMHAEILDNLEALQDADGSVTGVPTGFIDLDQLLGGLRPGTLNIIGARPAMGKTSFALNIANHVALKLKMPTVIFSLEMTSLEISKRMLSSHAKVSATRMRDGKLTDQDWHNISTGMTELAEANLWIDDSPLITMSTVSTVSRRLNAQQDGVGLVIVDYLQLMSGRESAESRQVQISEISRSLKVLSRELECPVVALSQLSRGLEQRVDKRPMLADLRESGAIEQDADTVIFIYRDEVYHPETADKGQAEILVSKNRAGPTGVARLAWLAPETRFMNMARSH